MSLVLGAIAFTGCNSSNIEESPVKEGNFCFTVNMDAMTRATVEMNNVVFKAGDKVAFGAAEHATTDTVTKAMIAEYNTSDGMFYCDTVLDGTKSFDFYALWPYQAGPKGASFNLPSKLKNPNQYSTYVYVGKNAFGQVAQNIDSAMQYAPMIGVNTVGSPAAGASVNLHHLASMLEFSVKNATSAPVKFSSLKMTVGDGTKFCGTYYVDMTTGALSPSNASYVYDNCTVSIEGNSDDVAAGSIWKFYMPIAPVTLAAGTEITFDITASDGTLCRVVKHIPSSGSVTFEAGKWNTQNLDYTGASTIDTQTLAEVIAANASLASGAESTTTFDVVNATVCAQNGANVIVNDGTAYFLVYKKNADTVTNGDVISISGKIKNYYGILEFNQPEITKTGTAEVVLGNPVTYTDELFNSYASAPSTQYVKVSGACTIDGKKIDIAGSTVQLYYTYANTNVSFEGYNGKDVVCEGFLYGYNSTSHKASFLATSVAEDSTAPSLTLSTETLHFNADDYGATSSKPVTTTVVNTTLTDPISDASWCVAQRVGNTIYVTAVEQNTTGATRTATVTVTTAAGISKTITVTQAPAAVTGTTIADVLAGGEGKTVTIEGVTVYALSGQNFIIGDASGFMLFFDKEKAFGLALGDIATVSGTTKTYNGILEIEGSSATKTGAVTSLAYPTPVTFSQSDFTAYATNVNVQYVSTYGTYSNRYIHAIEGEYYTSNNNGQSFFANEKTYNCTGFTFGYSTSHSSISLLVTSAEIDATAPFLSVTPTSLTFTADENGSTVAKEISCTVENTTLSSAVASESWLTAEISVTNAGVVTVYPTSANTSTSARTATVTINTAAGLSKTVTVTQQGKSSGNTRFVKVTSAGALADGDYLIVYEAGSFAFNGSLTNPDSTPNTISVSINGGVIEANSTTTAAIVTYSASSKTLKTASGLYIGFSTKDKNGLSYSTTKAYENTITIDSDGNADIVTDVSAHMRYNTANDQAKFRYFKSSSYTSQKAIQLYKKTN